MYSKKIVKIDAPAVARAQTGISLRIVSEAFRWKYVFAIWAKETAQKEIVHAAAEKGILRILSRCLF